MEKRCFKCGENKPVAEFYRHAMMADGHLNKCKECAKQDVRLHRQDNPERVRAYDRERAKQPHRLAQRQRRADLEAIMWPHRQKARNAVTNAVRDGRRAMASKPRNVRRRLYAEQGGKCYYCARKVYLMTLKKSQKAPPNMATLDHIIPLSRGGAWGPSRNCVVACNKCNLERGTKDARTFLLEKMGLV